MKSRTIFLFFVLFALLSNSQFATAQDKDPPPEPVFDPQNEPIHSDTPLPNTSPPLQEKTEPIDRSSSGSSPRSVADVSGEFYIGDKQDPATAHGGDYYAVAYIEDGALHVTTFTEDLSEINTYYDLSEQASNPDVAYEASTGLFIVVWQYDWGGTGTDYDIRALALDPDTGQVGDVQWVVGSGDNETDPSVDCNPWDSSCLVAYKFQATGSPGIEGRFMRMTPSGVSSNSDPKFDISTTIGKNPYVVFGDDGYLVAYTWDDLSTSPYPSWPVYSHVYPTHQSSGNQYRHDTTYVIEAGDLTDAYDKYSTGVAYDACANKFVVTFTYDFFGDGSDLDVLGRAVNAVSQYVYDYFWIAASTDNETSADISFIEDYHLTNAPPYASKLVVAYSRWGGFLPEGIYATDLLSNCSDTSPSYRIDPSWKHFLVATPSPIFGSSVYEPSITGAGGYKQFLVAWTEVTGGTIYNYDVRGRLMDASEKNFLPLMDK